MQAFHSVPPRARDGLALLFFPVLGLVVFAPELFLGRWLLDGDIYKQSIPVLAWYKQAIAAGQDGLWAPSLLGGFPVAFSQYSLLSPVDSLMARLLEPNQAYVAMLAIHLPLAGIATYCYARVVGLSRPAALLAGTGYQLSTESVALGINGYLLRTLFLLPCILLTAEMVIRRGAGWGVLAALALGAALFSGTAYITAIALVSAGLYCALRAAWLILGGATGKAISFLATMGIAVALGVGVAALRVLPGTVVTAESVRTAGVPFGIAASGAPDLGFLLMGYLLPLTRVFDFGLADRPSFVGPAILSLAVMALPLARKSYLVVLWMGLLLFNLLASLGDNTPLFGLLHHLPPFSYFRSPTRFSVASAFFLSMLAAYASDRWLTTWQARPAVRRSLALAAALSTTMCVAVFAGSLLWIYGGDLGSSIRTLAETSNLGPINPLRPRIGLALLGIPVSLWAIYLRASARIGATGLELVSIGLTTTILLVAGVSMIPLVGTPSTPPQTLGYLRQDESKYRVMALNPGVASYDYLLYFAGNDPTRINPYGMAELEFEYRYQKEVLAPNFAMEYGMESIDGYEVLQSIRQGIALAYIGSDSVELDYFDSMKTAPGGSSLGAKLRSVKSRTEFDRVDEYLPLLRAFNVKYLLTNRVLKHASEELPIVFKSEIPMLDPQALTTVNVYRVEGIMPRAYLVPEAIPVNGPLDALDRIRSGEVDPQEQVLLEGSVEPLPDPRLTLAKSRVERVETMGSSLEVDLVADGSGYLVISDAYYPGWSATVDGNTAPLHVANGWVRAVPVGSGRHIVRMSFSPPLFELGVCISAVSLLLCAAWVGLGRWCV